MNQPQFKPILIESGALQQFSTLRDFKASLSGIESIDTYKTQLRELFAVEHPQLYFSQDFSRVFEDFLAKKENELPLWKQGTWVHYPWTNCVIHILSELDFFTLRTARNRSLITGEEQRKFYDAVVGIAGLSLGMSVALALVLEGGTKHIKIADADTLELSNMNRIPVGITNLGLPKVEIAARRIYEINPYAEVEIFRDGFTQENAEDFFGGEHPLHVMVDEVDNLAAKALIRKYGKKKRVPVVMAADCDSRGIIDVERFDLDSKITPFHGRLGNHTAQTLRGLDKQATSVLIRQHIGEENHTKRMEESLKELGKTLVSWPQLGGTALQNGAAISYVIRQIVMGKPTIENRAVVALDKLLGS